MSEDDDAVDDDANMKMNDNVDVDVVDTSEDDDDVQDNE